MRNRFRTIALFFTAAMVLTLGGHAQQREVIVHSNGQQVHTFTTTGTNRMFFRGGNAIFTHNGDEWPIAVGQLDSITFGWSDPDNDLDTVAVNLADAVTITWDGSTVSVTNPYASQIGITHNGGHVVINSTIDETDITYILRGTSSDGSVTMTTNKKFLFCLDGLQLTNPAGPAIKIASDKRCAIHTMGTSILADGIGNTEKAALQARGKLLFQGTGVLNISGFSKHGIQSSGRTTLSKGTIQVLTAMNDGLNVDDFVMHGGTLIVNSLGDGVDGDQGYILIDGGTLDITCPTDDVKGLSCDSSLTIGGGNITITVSGAQSKAIKTKSDMLITGGDISVHADGTLAFDTLTTGYEPSYCTGIKVGGSLRIMGGSTAVVCPADNAGGKAINVDGSIVINDGLLNLTAIGACNKYTNSNGTFSSYSSTCIKSNGDISVTGGNITLTAGGRGFSCDGNFSQSGGVIEASTDAAGFTTIGSGTSCTDGFAAACLNCDGNIVFTGGTFTASSTGKGGRGIVADGTLTIGRDGDADSLFTLAITTSGAPVNTTSGGGGWPGGGGSSASWKGLAKGIKIQDTIHILSGHVMSYCSQTSGDPTAEAIESKGAIIIDGGTIEANAYDDAINAGTYLSINGGRVWAYSRGNDGIDCNGTNTYVTGGTVIVYGREVGFDANTDRGGHFYLNGGTVVSQGGTMGAWDSPSSGSTQKYLSLGGNSGGWPGGGGGSSVNAANGFCIMQGADTIMVFKAPTVSGSGFQLDGKPLLPPPGGGSSIAVSTPAVVSGSTYSLYSSVTITDGVHWHGLYSTSNCTTSGSPTSLTPR